MSHGTKNLNAEAQRDWAVPGAEEKIIIISLRLCPRIRSNPLRLKNYSSGTMVQWSKTMSDNVGTGTTGPSALLVVNSDIIRLRTAKTPASASDTGNTGDICWDADYVYICVAANTWKRAALTSW